MHNLSPTEIKVMFLTCGNFPCGGFAGTKYLQTMVGEILEELGEGELI